MSTGGDRVLCGRGHTASVVVDVSMESLAQSFKQQQGMNCFLRKTHRVGTRRLREFQENKYIFRMFSRGQFCTWEGLVGKTSG